MKKCIALFKGKQKLARGFTIIELVMASAVSLIPISAILVLLIIGQRNWQDSYDMANRQLDIDGQKSAAIFRRVGKKSDYDNCKISRITKFTPQIICGEEVEFRYWSNKRTQLANRRGQIDTRAADGPNEFARFYTDRDDGQLKLMVDYGPSPYKGRGMAARTVVLAENVESVEFSRDNSGKTNQGSVRMKLMLEDPEDGKKGITVLAAALMRN
ncbi:MAG: PilW family protein [Planctomycetota bacterium]|jgi:hypothetical protein